MKNFFKNTNWKLRGQNKATLLALSAAALAFVYAFLGLFGIVPTIGQDEIMNVVVLLIDVLVFFPGIVVDPTTPGFCDTDLANSREHINEAVKDVE